MNHREKRGQTTEDESSKHPNVLLIMCDEMRQMAMSRMGNPNVHTPNLDRLAREGASWNHMYTPSPVCCPARASMHTGFYPHNAGFDYNNDGQIAPRRTTLAEHFRRHGYTTGHIGKWHLAGPASPDDRYVPPEHYRGFQHWLGYEQGHAKYRDSVHYGPEHKPVTPEPGVYETEFQANHAIDFINENDTGSWFLDLSFGPPHFPLTRDNAPPGALANFNPNDLTLRPNVPAELPQSDRAQIAVYYAMIQDIDAQVGRIMHVLDKNGLSERTLVVFTSDHGDMLFSHNFVYKRRIHEESSRVPFVARYPGSIPAGLEITDIGSLVDLPATLLDLSGLDKPDTEGVSLSSRLRDEQECRRTFAPMGCAWLGCRPRGGWHAKRHWRGLRYKQLACSFIHHGNEARPVELFDLEDDPYQTTNLVGDPRRQSDIADLWHKLQSHIVETNDERFVDLTLGSPMRNLKDNT